MAAIGFGGFDQRDPLQAMLAFAQMALGDTSKAAGILGDNGAPLPDPSEVTGLLPTAAEGFAAPPVQPPTSLAGRIFPDTTQFGGPPSATTPSGVVVPQTSPIGGTVTPGGVPISNAQAGGASGMGGFLEALMGVVAPEPPPLAPPPGAVAPRAGGPSPDPRLLEALFSLLQGGGAPGGIPSLGSLIGGGSPSATPTFKL